MATNSPFSRQVTPDWEGLLRCVKREGTPERVHFIELFLDAEVQEAVCRRFNVTDGLNPEDPFYSLKRQVRLQRFLGYDYVTCALEGLEMPLRMQIAKDTATLQRDEGRSFVDEHRGPITSWEEFERYPWPNPCRARSRSFEWYEANLPDDMCVIACGGFAHFAEQLAWLMGYETLCLALFDQPELVRGIRDRLIELYQASLERMLEFDRVKLIWGSDDMGFKNGPLLSPRHLRELVLPGHRLMAQMSHDAGRPYLLHSCGDLTAIMNDLIEDVRIDAKHSFEDVIQPVTEAKKRYGDRIALLGGIDVDFLCRQDERHVRERVHQTLEHCIPGGGYVLGTGNSVANYIPLDHFLVMLDEGRQFHP